MIILLLPNRIAARALCLLLLLWSATLSSRAQSSPAATLLTGTVLDDKSRTVEFAAVLLLHPTDSLTVVQATATDTLGVFRLTGVPPGEYVVKISALGYRATYSGPFAVQATTTVLPLGTVTLRPGSKMLGEVVVKGERPMIERSLGKLTLNVSNSFFNTATNALEVLRRAPGVQVSPLGAITLNGTIAPVVYLDGRQLPLTTEELQSLSTADIEQVEIMSNASARYDGATRAVINIHLKRDKTLGLKGNAYAGGSLNRRYPGYEAGISGAYKTKKWVYYGRVGYSEINNFTRLASQRIVSDPTGGQTKFGMATFLHSELHPLFYQASADYLLTKTHVISLLVKGLRRQSTDATTNTTNISTYSRERPASNAYQLPSTTLTDSHLASTTLDLSYRGILNAQGDELLGYVDYAHFVTRQVQNFQTHFPPQQDTLQFPQLLIGQFPTTTHIGSLRTDYTHSLGKTTKMSLGAKLTRTKTDNQLLYDTLALDGSYVRDATRSNQFLYQETIAAAYAGLTAEWGKNTIDGALRGEHTQSTGNSVTLHDVVERRYYRWLPSLQAQRKFDENNTVALTFARKMQRPSFYDLNPFQFYTSPYEYLEGNPFLLPATVNTTELRYSYKDITVSASYELIRDQVGQVPLQDEQTKVLRYTRTNLDRVREMSLTLTAPTAPAKWWKMQHTLVLYHTKTDSRLAAGTIQAQAWSGLANGQQIFTLPKDITLEVSYNYSAPGVSQIYRTRSSGTVNLSFQKPILKGKGSLQMTAADIFNSYRESFYGQFGGLDLDVLQTRSVQQFSTRLTYRFGKSTFTRRGRSSGSAEEEARANR
jgi:hypothetical protein